MSKKSQELRSMNEPALRAREEELARDIAFLRFGGAAREKNNKKLISLRHERARVLTILRERELRIKNQESGVTR